MQDFSIVSYKYIWKLSTVGIPRSYFFHLIDLNLLAQVRILIKGRVQHFYRPRPKDGEGNVFTGVCLLTGGYPLVPGPFQEEPPSPFTSPVTSPVP